MKILIKILNKMSIINKTNIKWMIYMKNILVNK